MRSDDVGGRPTNRADLADWYAAVLARQAKSGLSVTKYAARVGVSAWTLYEWRKRAMGAGRRARAPKLVEVTVAGQCQADGLVVRVCGGRRSIAVSPGFDAADLRRLVEVLESC